jgi:DNA replication and repair protein RecF
LNFFKKNKKKVTDRAASLFNGEIRELTINYDTKFKGTKKETIAQKISQKIEENLFKEIGAGMTLYGPHREDYVFYLGKIALKESGSRGQQRLASFVFTLSLLDSLINKNRKVILLLDDLMSELDSKHRSNIEDILSDLSVQTIITSADKNDFSEKFLKSSNLIASL